MILKFYYCKDDNYSTEYFITSFNRRVLHHFNGNKIEVSFSFTPEVEEHSDDRFNLMLLDKSLDNEDDDAKYFSSVTFYQKQQIKWMYNNHYLQQKDNIHWLLSFFIGTVTGLVLGWLKFKC